MISQTVADFWELYHQLPPQVCQRARSAYKRFLLNPLHPSLHFHRLATYAGLWSVRITRNHRAVGFVEGDTITWFWIGDHKEFDQAFPR